MERSIKGTAESELRPGWWQRWPGGISGCLCGKVGWGRVLVHLHLRMQV